MHFLEKSSVEEQAAVRWMEEAGRAARTSLCHNARCGSVIISNDEIIGSGYNAPPLDAEKHRRCNADLGPGKPKFDRTCCMHAEWRAILDAMKRNPTKIGGSKLYFCRVNDVGEIKKSGKPYCTVCSRIALDSGISQFILWHDEGICEYPTGEYDRLSYEYQS